MKTKPSFRRPPWWSIVAGLVAAGLPLWTHTCFRIPQSQSAPKTLYVLTYRPPTRDGWVAACLPEKTSTWGRERGYLQAGPCPPGASEILKRVAALPGDLVDVTPFGLWVNGRFLRCPRRAHDAIGRPVPAVPPGTYRVAPGTVWLYSDYSLSSWDSRYYGPLPLTGLRSTARPLWTTPEDHNRTN